jgi:hypothetical protein
MEKVRVYAFHLPEFITKPERNLPANGFKNISEKNPRMA